jgi:hypothetical protein
MPYAEQESEELGDEVIARLNPQTGDIENIEVLFSRRGYCAATQLTCRWMPAFTPRLSSRAKAPRMRAAALAKPGLGH